MTATDADPTDRHVSENDAAGQTVSDDEAAQRSVSDAGVAERASGDANTTEHGVDRPVSRRAALRALGGVAAAGATLGTAASGAQAQSAGDVDAWLEDTSNYDGVVDRTGSDAVTVEVGVEANQGAFGFGPAAIRVSPGTTVTWEWNGKGGSHNVVHTEGNFESDLVESTDYTFEHTFESEGTYTYSCVPHETLGMKGAVVVDGSGGGAGGGDGESGGGGAGIAAPFGDAGARNAGGLALGGVFAAALASPGLFGAFLWFRERGEK
ncbi:halocyanin domain-containing protein [Halobellus limi]|uniref:Halocyanin domain-containing protein n=1 Tax=Halobellus limi TaxID=699433 RepID=A0A1H6BAI9_9EURY|nr:halocyanin domain-containing protein [Halobellus limi]SEG57809.1 halocyanin domain-containing protein [Halobellus limi]